MRQACTYISIFTMLWAQSSAAIAQADPDMGAARAANSTARAGINAKDAAAVVPGYGTTPVEASLYGQEDLKSLGERRLTECSMRPDDVACQAQLGAAASARAAKPQFSASDPDIASAKAIAGNPFASVGGLADYYAGCRADSSCNGNVFCMGEKCFDTTNPNDQDFAQAMTFLEAAREAGVYLDTATMKVFSGEDNRCRDRLLKNCCYANRAGAGFTNQSLFGGGSRLVYDVLMNSGNRQFVIQGMKSLLTSQGFGGTFTSYGITIAANGTALPAGSVSLLATDSIAIAFNPWTLAIAVVMYAAVKMMSCSQDEGKLAMKEGAKLCHSVGTWCSTCLRVLGKCVSCVEHTTSKCCFNSKLARMINEQGRTQFDMTWGTPKSAQCSGFSVAQLQMLDFAKMDLSEFYASIVPTLPNVGAIKAATKERAAKCYYGKGAC